MLSTKPNFQKDIKKPVEAYKYQTYPNGFSFLSHCIYIIHNNPVNNSRNRDNQFETWLLSSIYRMVQC